jgi:hypothetical protein
MLRSFKGTWRWHRKTEGGPPPSVFLSSHDVIAISNILSVQIIEPAVYGRFLFCARANASTTKKLAVIGSFLSRIGSLIEM